MVSAETSSDSSQCTIEEMNHVENMMMKQCVVYGRRKKRVL